MPAPDESSDPPPERTIEYDVEIEANSELLEMFRHGLLEEGNTPVFELAEFPMPNGAYVTLTVTRYEQFSSSAVIATLAGDDAIAHPVAPEFRYIGVGMSEAGMAHLSLSDTGITGVVVSDGQIFRVDIDGNDGLRVRYRHEGDAELTPLDPDGGTGELLAELCCVGVSGGVPVQYADIAINTDDEMFDRFNGDLNALYDEIRRIMSRVNTVYFLQAQVLFRITWVGMTTGSPADPFIAVGTRGGVVEFQHVFEHVWRHNPKRDITMLISGRPLGGSQILPPWTCVGGTTPGRWCDDLPSASCDGGGTCEWTGPTIGIKERAYVILQHRHQNFVDASTVNANNAAHEIGHIFGAEHTHCQQPPVDECSGGGQSMRRNACFAGTPNSNNNQPSYIMSYCPLIYGSPYGMEFSAAALQQINAGRAQTTSLVPAQVIEITSGTPVTSLTSSHNAPLTYFGIQVPPTASSLVIETSGGSGSARLAAAHGALPSSINAMVSESPGTTQQRIEVNSAGNQPGWWFIIVWDTAGFSNIQLTATVQ